MINKMIVKTIPLLPKSLVYVFAKKYIAGPELQDAVNVTKELEEKGGMTTIDVLGEFVETKDGALHEKGMCLAVLDAIKEHNLPTYLSIKPTSLGLGIDMDFAYDNISELAAKAKDLGIFMRLDMENSPYTDKTLDTYKRLRKNGFDNIGFVLQAYMKRSEDDIRNMQDYKPNIRLCKGIYNEAPSIAYKDPDKIRENYKKLLRMIFDGGMYPGIATHDEELIRDALNLINEREIKREDYEFQMLLGVRDSRRDEILEEGHRLRVYVPFGEDWYGYSTRRLKENPQMAGHVFKAIFTRK